MAGAEARDTLQKLAVAAYRKNISNISGYPLDSRYFADGHIRQLKA